MHDNGIVRALHVLRVLLSVLREAGVFVVHRSAWVVLYRGVVVGQVCNTWFPRRPCRLVETVFQNDNKVDPAVKGLFIAFVAILVSDVI